MAIAKSVIKSPVWAIAAILITLGSVVWAVATGAQNSANTAAIEAVQAQVHSLDVDHNVQKAEYADLKETVLSGFAEQKTATKELKALLEAHVMGVASR
jgi:competence protein ComGC